MPESDSSAAWALAAAGAFCVGLSKAGFGGLGIVAVVLFAGIFPARQSTGALLPLLIAADCLGVWFYRRHTNWHDLRKLLPATFAGVVCGWWMMPRVPDGRFAAAIGWILLALAALALLQRRFPCALAAAVGHPALGQLAGWAGGVTTMLANAAGAITTVYLLARRMDKMAFVGTAAWYFLAVNLLKVPFSVELGLIDAASLRFGVLLLPAVLAGAFAGRFLLRRVSQQVFELAAIGLAAMAALRLVWMD